jgi:hypothetical protein
MKIQQTTYVFKPLCLLCVLALDVVLTACGGGGGGGGSTTNPLALSLTPTAIKTFHFSWTDVADETEYRLLEDPDGASGYTQVATLAADATSHDLEVFLPTRINARYILQACNSGGCTDSTPVYVSGTLAAAVGYVKASNTETEDFFGCCIALSGDGNTLAVGAYPEDSNATSIGGEQGDNSAIWSGAVYVFTRSDTGTWLQQAYVKASNSEANDRFGTSVALAGDGNTLAVGAYGEASDSTGVGGDQNNNSGGWGSGAVYVFTRNDIGTWTQQAYVKASNTGASDGFGVSVALAVDGHTLAVGASGEDSNATGIDGNQSDNSANGSGAVYVFTRNDIGTWTQQAYVKASNTGESDGFGGSIALAADGNTLAVGASGEANSGAVYIFARSGANWSQQAYLKASNSEGADVFGVSVALAGDGNTLAVGAYGEDSNATSINGDQIDNSASSSGAVYVFIRSGITWTQQAYVKASNTGEDDEFGRTVALAGDGNTLAVGARYEASNATGIGGNQSDNLATNSGAVYVLTRNGIGTWTQKAYVKASNTEADDRFGFSVALTDDGTTLAVGALREASNATGINGNQSDNSATGSGAVYLY